MGLDISQFGTYTLDKFIKDTRKILVPFTDPITLCRDITSYNATCG